MGNNTGKTETYRSKSLSKIFSGKNLDKSFFQQNNRRQGSNLRNKKQSIQANRQSTPKIFIPQQRNPSPSFIVQRKSIEEINTQKILNHQKKDQIDEVKKTVHFCQDFFQQFLCNNINNCVNNESNFLNWNYDNQQDINPNINLLSRKFSKTKFKKNNEFDKFLKELFRKEYQCLVEQYQQEDNTEQQISKSSNSIEQKDLFPFLNKKNNKSRSISASSNERDFKPNSFRILNGHVFSFQTELQKQKQEKQQQEIQQQKPEQIEEVSDEESSFQQIQPIEELDLISQQKLNKFINKSNSQKQKKQCDLFEDKKYQALLQKEKQLEQETQQPMRIQIDINNLKQKSNKIEMEEPRLIDQIFHNSTQNSLKEIKIKSKKFNLPKKTNTKNKKNKFYSQKQNQKISQFQQNFPSYQQSYKNKVFNPEKYLKGEQTIQPFIKPQIQKPITKKKVNILQRFRESGKKRKNESLRNLHQEDSIEFEQQSIESDLYRDILKDFKSGYNKQDSLEQNMPKIFTKKNSQKSNKISIDISNLSKRMQNNFKH